MSSTDSRRRKIVLTGLALLPLSSRFGRTTTNNVVRIDNNRRFQTVEGFGTSLNAWHMDVADAYQRQDWATFYLQTLGASALRIELWSGVAPLQRDRWQEISWKDFDFSGPGARAATTIGVAKRLSSASKNGLRIIASTWTPPPWMKVNALTGNGHPARKNFALNLDDPVEGGIWTVAESNEIGLERYRYLGRNKLRRDRYLHFAKYLVEWSRYLRSQDVPLYALSPTNEPRFSHWFESCVYTPDEYAELLDVIAWMFANQGEAPVQLFGPEHMTWDFNGNQRYLEALKRRHGVAIPLAAVASHGYIDGYRSDLKKESASAFKKLAEATGKKIWVTEGGFGGHKWPDPLHQLGATFLFALRDGEVSLITAWQSLTRQPFDVNGLMSLRGPTKKTYVAMQFWRFVRPGMIRIDARSNTTLDIVAFENPRDDSIALISLNRSQSPLRVSLNLGSRRPAKIDAFFVTDHSNNCLRAQWEPDIDSVTIPAESIATLILRTRSL